jgi:hypothetical protein
MLFIILLQYIATFAHIVKIMFLNLISKYRITVIYVYSSQRFVSKLISGHNDKVKHVEPNFDAMGVPNIDQP